MKPDTKTASTLAGLAVVLSVLLSACGPTATLVPTVDVNVIYTQAAVTVVSGLTQTVAAMPTATLPPATFTPRPSATPTLDTTPASTSTPRPAVQPPAATLTPVPVDPRTAHGCYNAAFVADVTIQYAPNFNPGDRFTKVWRVMNTGTCDWPRGFKIAYQSGDRFGADTTVIDQKVTAGALADISLAMIAPNLNGVVTSNWQLSTDIGKTFGPFLPVTITLPARATNTTSPSSTQVSGGCLNSVLVSDVTIPTGTELQTNQAFTKTWLVKNTGTCTWNKEFKIIFVGGDLLGADTTKIRQAVASGESVEISLAMTAPATTGTISSAWQLASDDNQLFGQLFAFSIVVK